MLDSVVIFTLACSFIGALVQASFIFGGSIIMMILWTVLANMGVEATQNMILG